MKNNRLTFGLLIDWPDNNSKYQSSLIKGISSFAAKYDINIIILGVGRLDSDLFYEKPREILYDFMANDHLFSGFILFSSSLSSFSGTKRLCEKIAGITSLPLISVALKLPDIHSVVINNKPGFEELVEHLVAHHKYRDIAYISGPKQSEEALERLEIVKKVLSKHKIPLPESHLFFGNFTMESGIDAIRYFLDEQKIMPEAIIAANDNMAMGAWETLKDRHISVPGDIAVTGFDDLQISPVFDLPFTTVKQPLFRQGYMVAENLYKLIKGESIPLVSSINSQIVYRNSCGCLSDIAQIQKEEDTNETNGKAVLFETSRKNFKKAVKRELDKEPGEPLIRCWNRIILTCLEKNIRKSEINSFLLSIREEYSNDNYSDAERKLVNSSISKFRIMASEFYLSSDLLKRANEETMTKVSLNLIEGIGDDKVSLPDQIQTLENILPSVNMEIGAVSLFKSDTYSKDGQSELLFYYENGEVRKPENPVFNTKDLLHPEFQINKRFEILVELLFQEKSQYGILILDMNAKGINIFETIRTRLSRIIELHYSRQDLIDLNRQLQNEIQVRHETEKKLQKALVNLKDLSLTDELTGLYNRRGFMTLGEQQLRYSIREKEAFTIFYADMDGLKTINDKYGHKAGDEAIRLAAEILRKSFRDTDIVARLGGDEFTVLATKADRDNISKITERIEENTCEVNNLEDIPFIVSISIGIYFSEGKEDMSLEEMMNTADRELYKVKKKKRK